MYVHAQFQKLKVLNTKALTSAVQVRAAYFLLCSFLRVGNDSRSRAIACDHDSSHKIRSDIGMHEYIYYIYIGIYMYRMHVFIWHVLSIDDIQLIDVVLHFNCSHTGAF